MVVATLMVSDKSCDRKSNGFPLNIAVAKLGQDLVDFFPEGFYAPLVEVKVKKAYEWVGAMDKTKACQGMEEILLRFLPDLYK
jgi:hypothetical protein